MRIDANAATDVLLRATGGADIGTGEPTGRQVPLSDSLKLDTVSVSNDSGVYAALCCGVKDLDEVHAEKIRDLTQSISNGTYHVPPQRIAAAMYRGMSLLRNNQC